jgi:hypothetical protein
MRKQCRAYLTKLAGFVSGKHRLRYCLQIVLFLFVCGTARQCLLHMTRRGRSKNKQRQRLVFEDSAGLRDPSSPACARVAAMCAAAAMRTHCQARFTLSGDRANRGPRFAQVHVDNASTYPRRATSHIAKDATLPPRNFIAPATGTSQPFVAPCQSLARARGSAA